MARKKSNNTWPAPPTKAECCALCGREVPKLTEHHLIPRIQGRRRGHKLSELPTIMLCPACHKYLHKTFSNAELETEFPTLEALQANEQVQKFVAWVQKQPASKGVQVH